MKCATFQWRWVVGLVCLLRAFPAAEAVPARPGISLLRQPDGAMVPATLHGDEFVHWVSVSNRVVRREADGSWRWVVAGKTGMQAAGRAGLDAPPADGLDSRQWLRAQPPAARAPARTRLRAAAAGSSANSAARAPQAGSEKLLVLLASFTDRTNTTSLASWKNLFFGASGKTLRTYYQEASKGSFSFEPAPETQGTYNDGIVSVKLNYPHPDSDGVIYQDDYRQIVSDALKAANPYVNFAQFDTDKNGGLSARELHVTVVVAGYEASYDSSSPAVWGHSWSLYGAVPPPKLDGVYVAGLDYDGGYTEEGEWQGGHMATMGVFCHELGHDLGLPDLYDTTHASAGVGTHCLMAAGSWGCAAASENDGATPTMMCAWVRQQLGFVTPMIASQTGMCYIAQSSDQANYYPYRVDTARPGEYFLIENRQLTGFDAGLWRFFSQTAGGTAGGGMAVWHVDENVATDNDNYLHKLVDLEEANEGKVGYSELDAYKYPYTQGNVGNRQHYYYFGNATAFNNLTTPDSRLYSGKTSQFALTGVSPSGPVMAFVLSSFLAPEVPRAQIDPLPLDFGDQRAGGSSDLVLRMQNAGGGMLTGTVSVAAPFAIAAGGELALAAGQSQDVTIRFQPATGGVFDAEVALNDGFGTVCPVHGVAWSSVADTDGDGMDDWSEVYAGTSPTNPYSCFMMTGWMDPRGRALAWPGASDRVYSVWRSTNLLRSFSPIMTNLPPAFPYVIWVDTAGLPASAVYYHIGVERP